MNNQEGRGFHPVYILAGFYVFVIYMFPIIFLGFNMVNEYNETTIQYWPLALPLLLGVINLFVVVKFKNKIGRDRLLNCAILIKYTLIPFYVIGGLIIAIALLLMLTPVVIMVFVGPMVAIIFSVLGWTAIIGAAPFSIGYIRMSYKEKVHGKVLCVIAGILQFFFTVDVFSIMFLALKEKRCVKATITTMVIFLLVIIIMILWIILKILEALF